VTQSRVEWIRRVQSAMTKDDQMSVEDMRNIAARLEIALTEFQGKLATAKAQSPNAPVPKLLDEVKILAASLCVPTAPLDKVSCGGCALIPRIGQTPWCSVPQLHRRLASAAVSDRLLV